jgi:glycosyltransferase involved in cell wall biosynthesis
LAALSFGKSRPIIVNHFHNDPFQHFSPWQRISFRSLARWVDVQIASSESLGEVVKRYLGDRANRIEIIRPGLDLQKFSPSIGNLEERSSLRRGASRLVGAVGRLTEQKAFDVLIDALPSLLAEEPATRILIVGEGPKRRNLQEQARRLGVEGKVVFAGYQHDLVPFYQAMDVLALPSKHEGFGIVLIEAMAQGIPVVAARVVGIEDAVQDGENGLLVPYGDHEALASAISRVSTDPDLRHRLCSSAKKLIESTYAREMMTANFERLYSNLDEGSG